ncbi:hypothetical protein TI04_04095 [Achromatium sp. WMS2]|nr:hypothetical protein TI04_04095 [Achromatium sp. WMS2]
MKLPGLAILGLVLLALGGVSGWWILSQNTIDIPIGIATHDKSKSMPGGTKNSNAWLVWYGDDTVVYRLRVNTLAYDDLYASLRQSISQDQMRMESIAGSHLMAMLSPVFAELPPRLEPFLDNLFNISSSASFLSQALSVANAAVANSDQLAEDKAIQARERARLSLANDVVVRFRDSVLLPGFTLRALRAASNRAFLMVHQDLLENCDRYDRAFRDFVLKTTGTVESRDGDMGWRPDPSWQQSNATFLSLCPELRNPNVSQLADTPLIEAFTSVEDVVRAQALELVRPLTETSVNIALRTDSIANGINSLWIPHSLADPVAVGISSVTSVWTLTSQALNQLGGAAGRERFNTGLKATLDGLQTDSLQRLHSLYRSFIATEVERIGLNLAARSEGVWSHQ